MIGFKYIHIIIPLMKLNVGVIDVDILHQKSRFPNLAVMKISAFSKSLGHTTTLIYNDDTDYSAFDIIICSKVFDFSDEPPNLKQFLDSYSLDRSKLHLDVYSILRTRYKPLIPLVAVGGTGYFEVNCLFLHKKIEHIMPDYHIYDEYVQSELARGIKYNELKDYMECSIGFTSRGCFRRCGFCVNRRFKRCSKHSPVSEFLDDSRPRITMLDDNILACRYWKSILEELIRINKPFKFKQGIDVRLITPAIAKMLAKCKYDGDVTFAFDHYNQKDQIVSKLKVWRKYCPKKSTKLYILTAFEPYGHNIVRTPEEQAKRDLRDIRETLERVFIINEFRCKPYIMKYKAYNQSKYRGVYVLLARWCNQPTFFYKMSLEEFAKTQQKSIKTDKLGAPMRALELLKADAPDLYEEFAHRIGSLKFEE